MTGLFLWQNIFGVWPVDGAVTDDLRGTPARATPRRRSARQASTPRGTTRTPRSKTAVHAWIDAIIDGPIATELTTTVARLDEYARSDSLGQKLIQLTAPGVPDVYQGTELWDDSLVDPDNRRPVDFTVRREALAGSSDDKIRVVTAALRLRRDKPDAFLAGDYRPLLAEGPAAAAPGGLRARVRCGDRRDPAFGATRRNRLGRNAADPSGWNMAGPHRRAPVRRERVPRGSVRGTARRAAGADR